MLLIAVVGVVAAIVVAVRRSRSTHNRRARLARVALLGAAALSGLAAVIYPLLLDSQGTSVNVPVAFTFEIALLVGTGAVVVAITTEGNRSRVFRWIGVATLLVTGIASGFSIGGLLLIAAVLVALSDPSRPSAPSERH